MLMENSIGQSELIAAVLLLEEMEALISKMIVIIKKYNADWESFVF